MYKRMAWLGLTALVLGLLPSGAFAWMKEGTAGGKIITVGEDRLVIGQDQGGQLTIEVASVKQGDQFVKDADQLAALKTFKQGDRVVVEWGTDHTNHYFIRTIRMAGGTVRGSVITVGEKALVIAKAEGGQMTLQPGWIQVQGRWMQSQEQIDFFKSCKQGDAIEAVWILDGAHFQVETIHKLGEASPAAPAGPAAELQAIRGEIAAMRQEIAGLKALVSKALEKR